MVAGAKWASMHTEDSLVGPVESWHESCLPLGGPGVRGSRSSRSPSSPPPWASPRRRGAGSWPSAWRGSTGSRTAGSSSQAGQLQAWRLGMIAEATMCLSRDAAGFVDTHVAPVAHKIGPAQLMRLVAGGPGPVRPRGHRGRPAGGRGRPPVRRRAGPGVLRRDGARRGRPGPGRRLRPQHRRVRGCLRAGGARVRPSHSTCAVRRRSATWPAPSSPSGSRPPRATPKPRVPRRQVVLHAHIAAAAVTGATGTGGAADLARVQEILAAITTEQVRPVVRQPEHQGHREAGPGPGRAHLGDVLRSLRPAQDPDPAPRRHLRPPLLHPARGEVRLRAPGPLRPGASRTRADLLLQPRPVLSAAPSGQDHRRLDLRHVGTRHLPVALTAGLPVPPRPHRHHRRHPRRRPTPLRPRAHRPLRRRQPRPTET